jgi:hypothetical protein
MGKRLFTALIFSTFVFQFAFAQTQAINGGW